MYIYVSFVVLLLVYPFSFIGHYNMASKSSSVFFLIHIIENPILSENDFQHIIGQTNV